MAGIKDQVGLLELAAPCAIFGTDLAELAGDRGWYDFRIVASPASKRAEPGKSTSARS